MTVDEAPPRTAEQAALDGYRQSLRWKRRIYAAVIAVLVVTAAIVVKVAYSHGEISHATLRTTNTELIAPPLRPISVSPTQPWRSSDHSAIGTPVWDGTVVTYGPRAVRGRNALTGEITWSYTRTDRTVCTAIQTQGVTIAVFRLHGNCDQITALDSNTGKRKWFRTLDKDGHPLNGTPSYSVGDFTVLFTTKDVIYALDPGGGLDRWLYYRPGCAISGAVLGSQGALIHQTCTDPQCGAAKFCGPGDELVLRDATAGRSDNDKNNNPDQIKWSVPANGATLPVSADKVISAADPAFNSLQTHDAKTGRTTDELRLPGTTPSSDAIAAVALDDAELIWIGGATYAVPNTGDRLAWSLPTSGPPVVVPSESDTAPQLATAVLLVPTATGVGSVAAQSGKVSQQYAVEAPPPGSGVFPFSSGFIVAGSAMVAYR
ncbi:MAG TPA: PQQ-binding-like beta-propeller repeat protein [Jatrophihabitantaceae bacterium]|nr:PQQ-binding-like beta-propeller repeat protein [Jatrophihabitantaceae bacterium]